MNIEFNKVTWYSKVLALALFVALPFIGFCAGRWYQAQLGNIKRDVSVVDPLFIQTKEIQVTQTTTVPEATSNATTKGLSYGEAINKYQNKRIQINDSCQLNPSSMVLKNGTAVMFDNRSATSKNLSLGGTRYSLSGYDFRILTLSRNTLPATIVIDCGSGKNNGQVTLER